MKWLSTAFGFLTSKVYWIIGISIATAVLIWSAYTVLLVHQRNSARSALDSLRVEIKVKADAKIIENLQREAKQRQKEITDSLAWNDYITRVRKYYAENPTIKYRTIPNSVRPDTIRSDALPEVCQSAIVSSQGWEDQYRVLAERCAETTSQYNELYRSWKRSCEIAGGCLTAE